MDSPIRRVEGAGHGGALDAMQVHDAPPDPFSVVSLATPILRRRRRESQGGESQEREGDCRFLLRITSLAPASRVSSPVDGSGGLTREIAETAEWSGHVGQGAAGQAVSDRLPARHRTLSCLCRSNLGCDLLPLVIPVAYLYAFTLLERTKSWRGVSPCSQEDRLAIRSPHGKQLGSFVH